MIVDKKGNLFEDRRKEDRRKSEVEVKNGKRKKDRRTAPEQVPTSKIKNR